MKSSSCLVLVAALACATAGCKRDQPTAPAMPTPTPTMTPAATPPAAAGHRKMANCPSSVAGAKTAFAAIEGGVEVTITATAAPGATEIRERAKHLVEISAKNPATPVHTGEGEGGGMLGQCPVVLNDTALVAADVENGVKVTLKPNKAENLDWLKKEVEARTGKLAQ